MSRVPLNHRNLSSLQEDLRVLRLLPEETTPLNESKSNKNSEEKSYDYEDEMESTEEETSVEDTSVEDTSVEEAAQAVLTAFNSLSEEEVEDLDPSYFEAVENAAEVLGDDSVLDEIKRMTAAQVKARKAKAAKCPGETKKWDSKKKKCVTVKRLTRAQKKKRALAAKKYAKRYRESDNSLDNIIERLHSLTSPLAQESDEVGVISDKIVEGFKGVFHSANEIAQRIANELSEEESVDKSDPRYKLGVYFEGIADDAKNILDAIFSGKDVPMEDAIEDLQALTGDVKKGLNKASRIS